MYKILTPVFGLALLLSGCSSTIPATDNSNTNKAEVSASNNDANNTSKSVKTRSNVINYGTISNGVYTNDYFDMSVNIPKNWAIQSQAAQKELMEFGSKMIAGDDKVMEQLLEESQKQTVNLFSFFKFEQGTPVDFNPSISAAAEKMVHMPGIKRGSDYFFHAKKLLMVSQLNYEFPNSVYTTDISGVSFDVMPAQITLHNLTIYQNYYATRIQDYVLLIIITYSNDEEGEELTKIISEFQL